MAVEMAGRRRDSDSDSRVQGDHDVYPTRACLDGARCGQQSSMTQESDLDSREWDTVS